MQKNVIFIVLFVVVLITGVLLSNKFPANIPLSENNLIHNSSPLAVQTPNNYSNSTYNFSINYPFNLQLKESSPTAITIGIINDLETNSEVEIKVFDVKLKPNATESAEIITAKSLCTNSLPSTEIRCPKVISENQEVSTAGSKIFSFYLEEQTVNKATGEVINTEQKGPFISSPLKETRTSKTFILIYPPLDKDPHLVNAQLIRDVATSVTNNNK